MIVQTHQPRRPREYTSCMIAGIYIPPESNSKSEAAISQLNELINNAKFANGIGNHPLVFIAGDLNKCNVGPINQSHNLRRLNKKATRGTRLLDPVLSNAPRCYHAVTCSPLTPQCDHNIVKAIPFNNNYAKTRPPEQVTKKRTGKLASTVEQLGNINWQLLIVSKEHSVQAKFDIFYATVINVLDTCQPWRKSKRKGDKPWMTDQIKAEIAIRQRLLHQEKEDKWRVQRNKVQNMIRKRKRAWYQQLTCNNAWKAVNEYRAQSSADAWTQQKVDDQNICFNSIWDSSATTPAPMVDVNNNTNAETSTSTKPAKPPTVADGFEDLADFNQMAILNELKKLDSKKAPGPDEVPASVLKAARFELVDIIQHLFLLTILTGIVPRQWKEANTVPIPKVPRPQGPADYRGIALTATLCKIFERIMSRRMIYRTRHIWLTNDQHGFLPGKSTSDATIKVVDEWSKALDGKQSVYAIFFDFSKAFDLVDHELLLAKLNKLLPPMTTRWIANYLHGRKQRVKAGEHVSTWSDVKAGVIQGSVLGPTLFIIFIADLKDRIPKDVKAPKYADDILAWSLIQSLIEEAAKRIQEWTRENRMVLNKKKTVKMTLGNGANDQPVYIDGVELARVEEYKYLGIQITDQLNMDAQWNHISRSFNSTIYLLKTMRQLGFNQRVLVSVYKSLIISQIAANAPTLCSISEKAKNEMRSMQRRALRAMNIRDHEHLKYKITSTDDLIHERCITQLQRILNDDNHPVTKDMRSATTASPTVDIDSNTDTSTVAAPIVAIVTANNADTATTVDINNNTVQVPRTRNKFEFPIAKCNTERHMNTFVPKYMRQLESSGFVTEAVKRAAAEAEEAEKAAAKAAEEAAKAKRAAKPRIKCQNCGKLWINLGSHQRACKKPATTEEKEQHNQLPDFAHNFEHVTIRRTHTKKPNQQRH